MQGGEEQTNESEESSQAEDDGTTLEDIKVKKNAISFPCSSPPKVSALCEQLISQIMYQNYLLINNLLFLSLFCIN